MKTRKNFVLGFGKNKTAKQFEDEHLIYCTIQRFRFNFGSKNVSIVVIN